uniref:SPK domain-containing protein n=1 Tax=Caenorhabditis tropicalis TaxID=1561998 RepID=A0A1I7UK71_9PELO
MASETCLKDTKQLSKVDWKLFTFLIFYSSCLDGYAHILIRHWRDFVNVINITDQDERLLQEICDDLGSVKSNEEAKVGRAQAKVDGNKSTFQRLGAELHVFFVKLINENSQTFVLFNKSNKLEIFIAQKPYIRGADNSEIKFWKIVTSDGTKKSDRGNMEVITMYQRKEKHEDTKSVNHWYDCNRKKVVSGKEVATRKDGCFLQVDSKVIELEVFMKVYRKLNVLSTQDTQLRGALRTMLANYRWSLLFPLEQRIKTLRHVEFPPLTPIPKQKLSRSKTMMELPDMGAWSTRSRKQRASNDS